MLRPFRPQLVRSGQRSVSAADDESVDTVPDEVERSLSSALNLAEGGAAGSADQGSADSGEATDVVPADLPEIRQHSSECCRETLGLTRMM